MGEPIEVNTAKWFCLESIMLENDDQVASAFGAINAMPIPAQTDPQGKSVFGDVWPDFAPQPWPFFHSDRIGSIRGRSQYSGWNINVICFCPGIRPHRLLPLSMHPKTGQMLWLVCLMFDIPDDGDLSALADPRRRPSPWSRLRPSRPAQIKARVELLIPEDL